VTGLQPPTPEEFARNEVRFVLPRWLVDLTPGDWVLPGETPEAALTRLLGLRLDVVEPWPARHEPSAPPPLPARPVAVDWGLLPATTRGCRP
jgi:hypothetical protein